MFTDAVKLFWSSQAFSISKILPQKNKTFYLRENKCVKQAH